jgi:hypothetical protein
MLKPPKVKPGDPIYVNRIYCIVSRVYKNEKEIEVVFNPDKPTNDDVEWDGEKWIFPKTTDYGGYADRNSKLTDYVQLLKKGPQWPTI